MESIASADLIELILLQRGSFDTQFQFWITTTFAVIVASFAAGSRLSGRYRLVVAALYILSTFMLFARWAYDGREMLLLVTEVQSRGIDFRPPIVFALAKLVLIVFGTVTTLTFLYHDAKSDREKDS